MWGSSCFLLSVSGYLFASTISSFKKAFVMS